MSTTNEQLSYTAAISRYAEAIDRPPEYVAPQPNRSMSYRNDKDNGWVLNNVRGYLAFVSDRGSVLR